MSLNQMMDIYPQSCGVISQNGGIQAFSQRIQNIEFIDLAENAIKALEKLSYEHSK